MNAIRRFITNVPVWAFSLILLVIAVNIIFLVNMYRMVFVDAEYRFKDGKCIIYEISAVGPAERAGLQTGDVILAVNSIPIKEPAQLDFVVHLKSIPNPLKTGEPAIFKISRNDQEFSFTLIPSSMLSPRLPIRWIFRHL